MGVKMGEEKRKRVLSNHAYMLAAEYLTFVLRLFELGFAAKDEVLASHNPVVGQPTSPIKDYVSVFVSPSRILAKVNHVLLTAFALGRY